MLKDRKPAGHCQSPQWRFHLLCLFSFKCPHYKKQIIETNLFYAYISLLWRQNVDESIHACVEKSISNIALSPETIQTHCNLNRLVSFAT